MLFEHDPLRKRFPAFADHELAAEHGAAACGRGRRGLVQRGRSDRAQTNLKHDAVVDGRVAAVSIVADIVHADDEAIVNIARADDGLIDAVEIQIVAHATGHNPVFRELDRRRAEHAFAAGASPAPRLISDAERDLLIRQALAHAEALEAISGDLRRYGYTSSWDESAEDAFRARVLDTVTLLGYLGPRALDPVLARDAEAAIRATHGLVAADGGPLAERLHAAVTALLSAFPDSLAPQATSETARKAFRENHRALCDARERARLSEEAGTATLRMAYTASGAYRASPTTANRCTLRSTNWRRWRRAARASSSVTIPTSGQRSPKGRHRSRSERTLGHVISGVEGTYDQHDYVDEKADALAKLAALIEMILNPPADNVVRFGAGEEVAA